MNFERYWQFIIRLRIEYIRSSIYCKQLSCPYFFKKIVPINIAFQNILLSIFFLLFKWQTIPTTCSQYQILKSPTIERNSLIKKQILTFLYFDSNDFIQYVYQQHWSSLFFCFILKNKSLWQPLKKQAQSSLWRPPERPGPLFFFSFFFAGTTIWIGLTISFCLFSAKKYKYLLNILWRLK